MDNLLDSLHLLYFISMIPEDSISWRKVKTYVLEILRLVPSLKLVEVSNEALKIKIFEPKEMTNKVIFNGTIVVLKKWTL